jgi:single-stranded-DNA-specific exonuclease
MQTESTPSETNNSLHPIIIKILQKRGIAGKAITEFFSWDLHQLPDITQLKDMDKTVERIIRALENKERIGIYGDYDVDGTTSCALFYHFFQMLNTTVELIQPSRFVEGYGVHPSSIENAIAKGIKLLITVDCGISNLETAEYAKDRDIDLIITDHHKDAREHLPNAYAVVNPSRRDEDPSDEKRYLSGVGVAFAVCLAIKNEYQRRGKTIPSIYPLLQFVSIGTICDLAYLSPMNLKLSRHGLKQIPKTNYAGIASFFSPEEKNVDVMASEKISFYVGPLINSKGRLDHPEKALNLLIAKDHQEAFANYSHLEISNRERKIIQAEVFDEAKKKIIKEIKADNILSAIVYEPDWHEGVLGIVASKLVETFEVPAIVFANAEEAGVIKASARSAGELNLFHCLDQCKDLFIKFGGHKAAAGLSMRKENLSEFKARFNNLLVTIPAIERTVQDHYDINISFKDIDKKLVKDLDLMEPFGMGNERPVFRMADARLESFTILKDVHVKWTFVSETLPNQKLNGISFNFIGKWNTLLPEDIFQRQSKEGLMVQFQIGINRFRGNEIIQLMVDRIYPGL